MNETIQNHLVFIVAFLLFVIFGLMAIIILFLYKQLEKKNSVQPATSKSDKKRFKKIQPEVAEKFYCQNHFETPSSGACLICEEVFCENCLVEHDGMYFCKIHFKYFANSKWKQITDIKTTPEAPEEGVFVWNFKRLIWTERQIPTFVLTHYKINVDEDYIESYVQLNVREEDEIFLSAELKKHETQN